MAPVTASEPELQRITDVVSGFCALFGMKIATQKIRSLQVDFGKQNQAEYTLDEPVIHIGTRCQPVAVPVKHEGSFKYLGLHVRCE